MFIVSIVCLSSRTSNNNDIPRQPSAVGGTPSCEKIYAKPFGLNSIATASASFRTSTYGNSNFDR